VVDCLEIRVAEVPYLCVDGRVKASQSLASCRHCTLPLPEVRNTCVSWLLAHLWLLEHLLHWHGDATWPANWTPSLSLISNYYHYYTRAGHANASCTDLVNLNNFLSNYLREIVEITGSLKL